MWRQEIICTSDNRDNHVETGYWGNYSGSGILGLRTPEKLRWFEGTIYK